MSDRPHFRAERFACKKCGSTWDGFLPVNVAAKVWVAHSQSLRCPRCNADSRYIVLSIKKEGVEAREL